MLQRMPLDRWSQVTIYRNRLFCSIGLPREGAYHVCKTLQKLLANTPNRYESGCSWVVIKLIPVSFS